MLYVGSGSIASLSPLASHFRSTPNNGHRQVSPIGPVRANKRLMHRSKVRTNRGNSAVYSTMGLPQQSVTT